MMVLDERFTRVIALHPGESMNTGTGCMTISQAMHGIDDIPAE